MIHTQAVKQQQDFSRDWTKGKNKAMDFTKMTGAGNDFIVLGKESGFLPEPEAVRSLCDRRYGIGADGLMIIRGSSVSDAGRAAAGTGAAFSVDFYNADGSGGMLCGNGARCALVYAAARGFIARGKPADFSFAGRLYSGIALAPDRARFILDPRYSTRVEQGIKAGKVTTRGRYINLGSLHFVVDCADLVDESGDQASRTLGPSLEKLDVATLGTALRNHERFAPDGVNVNFCHLAEGRLQVRTFERGVEGETLACGTGSTASALSYALKGLVSAPVHIVTRSGEELIIDFDEPSNPTRLSLEGPAKVVFEGRI